jgi:aromatic ring-opening dioxygenase catalytic subunit (LigB family)
MTALHPIKAMSISSNVPPAPCLFLSHGGGPAMFMEDEDSGIFKVMNRESNFAQFYRNISSQFNQTPKAIVIISAHWEEHHFTVNCHQSFFDVPLLYDYSGFPSNLYAPHFLYPAVSNTELEDRVFNLICDEFGEKNVRKSASPRGFDHGVFIPLKIIFPQANIPIVQVSMTKDLDFSKHYRLGASLSSLLNDNIMIIGSGQATHNLRGIANPNLNASAKRYCQWLSETLLKTREDPQRTKMI